MSVDGKKLNGKIDSENVEFEVPSNTNTPYNTRHIEHGKNQKYTHKADLKTQSDRQQTKGAELIHCVSPFLSHLILQLIDSDPNKALEQLLLG